MTQTTRFVLTLKDLPAAVAQIAEVVRARGFAVDHIVYIETGARLLGHELARQLACTCSGIEASRKGGWTKRLLGPILRRLPLGLAHELRRLELSSGFHNRRRNRQVRLPRPLPQAATRVIVVDDAVDTGYSLKAVIEFLQERNLHRDGIMTAAVTITGDSPVYIPDVVLHHTLVTFPWSPGARDGEECLRLMQKVVAAETTWWL